MSTAKKTRIIATIGPSSRDQHIIENLLRCGADVFRLNFSHGTHEDHATAIRLIKAAAATTGLRPAILADLQGPKIRTGLTAGDAAIVIERDATVYITSVDSPCTASLIYVDLPGLVEELKKGDNVLINDGALALTVEAVEPEAKRVRCRALNTASYSSRKGVNFPHTSLTVPSLTKKDRDDISFIMTQQIDFVALSFVRRADDLLELRDILNSRAEWIRIIAKIEKPEAAENVETILDACDGIMVARGDLGVETPVERIPILQKDLIAAANAKAKTVIVATQMLESMISHLMPTRAEANDVANAILDGSDAVMLSGETAAGKYPDACVDMMAQIIRATEGSTYFARMHQVAIADDADMSPHAVCNAAAIASGKLGGCPIVVYTLSGETAWYLAKLRPAGRIIAFSPSDTVVRQLALCWNTSSYLIPLEHEPARLTELAEERLLASGQVKLGDAVVVVGGTTTIRWETNFMRVKKIGEN